MKNKRKSDQRRMLERETAINCIVAGLVIALVAVICAWAALVALANSAVGV